MDWKREQNWSLISVTSMVPNASSYSYDKIVQCMGAKSELFSYRTFLLELIFTDIKKGSY